MKPSEVTVVLPTRNERHNIRLLLDSLPAAVPLVVVDASDDDTAAVILAARTERTEVLRHPGGIATARQVGAERAATPWLLFTDADVELAADYFDQLGRAPACDVVYGPKLSRDRFARYYALMGRAQGLSHRLGIPAATGSNLLVRREVLLAVGGFDEALSCNEDSELVWRVRRAGFRVVFDPRLVVYARDHRRLERGRVRKTAHTLARCLLLYLDVLPDRWRRHDWGYWRPPQDASSARTPRP